MACSLKSVTFCLTLTATIASIGFNPAVAADVEKSTVVELNDYDVIIAGGSTAAFAAAIAAAESGARTALLEPTDWVGGQLTSSGVPAVPPAAASLQSRPPRR